MYFWGPTHATKYKSVGGYFCKKCNKDTKHFRHKCLECGTAYAKFTGGTRKATWADGLRAGRQGKAISKDKAAYWKRMAEESRKKFEGKS